MKQLSLLIVLMLLFSSAIFAEEAATPPPVEPPKKSVPEKSAQVTYFDKSVDKLGVGLMNFATGWTALLFEPTRGSNVLVGLAKGIGYTVTNTAGGAIQMLTFPIPVDIPLPGGGTHFD